MATSSALGQFANFSSCSSSRQDPDARNTSQSWPRLMGQPVCPAPVTPTRAREICSEDLMVNCMCPSATLQAWTAVQRHCRPVRASHAPELDPALTQLAPAWQGWMPVGSPRSIPDKSRGSPPLARSWTSQDFYSFFPFGNSTEYGCCRGLCRRVLTYCRLSQRHRDCSEVARQTSTAEAHQGWAGACQGHAAGRVAARSSGGG